ncbi:universal stress protein [Caulobacter flavus]|uniref:Universal stress protein n=1 Tax=Caulobacter flavus TaxID=1679497 RepID=A0A2N5CQH2_9CAUL|nr:universal stress protein [Caulobacter flavus]AYV48707.1 universal stress protein [Caulobacter flavus]PLR10239.1 universal stress protein [Caulobacter flavus]
MSQAVRSILVATDLAPRSDRAVDRALELGREWNADVHVVHAIERDAPTTALDVRRVLPDPGAKASVSLPYGPAPKAITDTARERGVDLLVTGVARYNDLGDYLLGTAVDHVVREAPCPVLVVKQRAHGPYQRLLIATDFSKGARAALLGAAALFPDARLHLVHAYHVPFESRIKSDDVRDIARSEAQGKLDALLADLPEDLRARIEPHLAAGEPGAVLDQVARDVWPDLVVIGARGISGLVQAALGSVASTLLQRIPVDTLVIKEG